MKPKAGQRPPPVKIAARRLPHAGAQALPKYQTIGAAGMDLTAAVDKHAPIELAPGARTLVPTGLALEIPAGYEAQIRPRSGLALRFGVTVLNSPGTIDSDYRGEVMVLLINFGEHTFQIERGTRIAQMVVAPVARAALSETIMLGASKRGSGGFGSTGTTARKQKNRPAKKGVAAKSDTAAPLAGTPAAKMSAKRAAKKKLASPRRKNAKPISKTRRARQ